MSSVASTSSPLQSFMDDFKLTPSAMQTLESAHELIKTGAIIPEGVVIPRVLSQVATSYLVPPLTTSHQASQSEVIADTNT